MEVFYRDHEDEIENLRSVYQNQVENLNMRMGEIFKTLSSDYEKVFRSYLERTTSFQESLGLFSVTRAQSLYGEIDDLKKTLKKMEERLKKIEK
jgi:predicted DNA-binding protein YlxM (UPF0122 family)